MKIHAWRIGTAVFLLALPALVFYFGENGSPAAVTTVTGQLEPPHLPVRRGMPFISASVASPAAPAKISKAAQVARLTATGIAADAYEAFNIAFKCYAVRLGRRFSAGDYDENTVSDACGDITALQIREMTKNLDKAVAADIPNALMSKFYYGPDGDLFAMEHRPDDPYVVAWKQGLLNEFTAYLQRTGEYSTMLDVANFYYFGTLGVKDVELAFGYRLVQEQLGLKSNDLRVRRNATSYPSSKSELAQGLTPEQLARARAFSQRFVATCCNKR
jgi:hypothetical protein